MKRLYMLPAYFREMDSINDRHGKIWVFFIFLISNFVVIFSMLIAWIFFFFCDFYVILKEQLKELNLSCIRP